MTDHRSQMIFDENFIKLEVAAEKEEIFSKFMPFLVSAAIIMSLVMLNLVWSNAMAKDLYRTLAYGFSLLFLVTLTTLYTISMEMAKSRAAVYRAQQAAMRVQFYSTTRN